MITPCVSLCRLDPNTRICEGCGRSQMEIFMWTKYSDDERMAVMKRLGYGRRREMSYEERRRRYERG